MLTDFPVALFTFRFPASWPCTLSHSIIIVPLSLVFKFLLFTLSLFFGLRSSFLALPISSGRRQW